MFFYVSKLVWIILQPLNFVFLVLCTALLLTRLGKRRIANWLFGFVVASFLIVGFTQLPDYLLAQLEMQYPVPVLTKAPYGIIVLGGGVNAGNYNAPLPYQLGEAGDRIITALALKQTYPQARLLYSGGSAAILGKKIPETSAARALINDLYGSDLGAELESGSRTTAENAARTAKLLGNDRQKNWLLVTSAFHQLRAMATFKKAGISVTAYPTDYIARPLQSPFLSPDATANFRKMSIVTKEILGIVAYRASNR